MSAALDPLDALIAVTHFTSASATCKSEKAICLRDLAQVIVTSQAPEKEALLWLKLARFGTRVTDRGSLRHNANVVEITGIEGDYDGEVMSIDEAEARLREVDVAALIYTSPSHTDAKPRWRVLAPLSKGYPPADRKRFLARLNGVLGGILSGESFVLSQSYYYGSIAGNPAPCLAWVEGGEFIDLLDELDATAIGRKKADDKPKTNGGTPHNEAPRSHSTSADEAQRRYALAACEAEMNELASTSKYRGTALTRSAFVLGTLVGAGALSENDAVAALQDAVRRNGLDETDGWARVNACIDRQLKAGMASPRDMRGVGTRAGRGAAGSWQEPPPHPGPDGPEPGSTSQWSEPLDLIGAPELVGWPELTTDCLPAPLYRYVMAEADRLNVDPCALAGHVLAACAASISDAWSIKPKRYDPWTQQPRVWVCIVKDVGVRGTDMIRSAFWPVYERDREAFKRWQKEYAEWKARQKQKGRDSGDDDEDPEPHMQRLVTNDANVEALSEILKDAGDYGKVTYHTDELAAFFGSFNRYTTTGGGARAAMLEAYDGGPQHIDRIKRGHVFVPNWSVNNAGNIQPRKLAGMAKDLIDDGLFQRFLKLHQRPPTPGRADDRPIAASIGRDYRELHTALAELQPEMSEGNFAPVYVEDEGYDVRQRLMRLIERLQFDPSLPTIIRETAPKWSGLHARLSLIFHIVGIAERVRGGEWPTIRERCCATGNTVTMAATFLRRIALPNLFRLGYETMPEEGCPAHARWIAGHILAHGTTAITGREIGRAYRMVRGKDKDIAEAMAVLVHAAWAVPQAARYDSSAWNINPAVHTIFRPAAEAERQRRAAVVEIIKAKISDL